MFLVRRQKLHSTLLKSISPSVHSLVLLIGRIIQSSTITRLVQLHEIDQSMLHLAYTQPLIKSHSSKLTIEHG